MSKGILYLSVGGIADYGKSVWKTRGGRLLAVEPSETQPDTAWLGPILFTESRQPKKKKHLSNVFSNGIGVVSGIGIGLALSPDSNGALTGMSVAAITLGAVKFGSFLLEKQRKWSLLKWGKPFVPTPFDIPGHFLTKGFNRVTEAFLKKKWNPSFLSMAVMLGTTSFMTAEAIDWSWKKGILEPKIQREISNDKESLELLLFLDFRYSDIKKELDDGTLSKDKALRLLHDRLVKIASLETEDREWLLQTPLFEYLKNMLKEGIPVGLADFEYEPNFAAHPSPATIDKLIKLKLASFSLEKLTPMVVNGDPLTSQIAEQGYYGALKVHINRSAKTWNKKILESTGKEPTSSQLIELICEDLTWKIRFEEFKLIGLSPTQSPKTYEETPEVILQKYLGQKSP